MCWGHVQAPKEGGITWMALNHTSKRMFLATKTPLLRSVKICPLVADVDLMVATPPVFDASNVRDPKNV
jgi:hypothetical protein